MHPERAKLDRQLKRKGEDVVLKRRVGTTSTMTSITLRASVRGYRPEQMIGTVTQQDSEVIASVSEILAADPTVWPGAAGGSMWPTVTDTLVIQGRNKQLQAATVILLDDQPVRIEARARG